MHALIGAIARRATAIASTTTARNMPHNFERVWTHTHQHHSGSRHNSERSAHTGRATIAASCTHA